MPCPNDLSTISNTLSTPSSNTVLSNKSITRKRFFNQFSNKKIMNLNNLNNPHNNSYLNNNNNNNEYLLQHKQIDRMKFISPNKTNFLINQNTIEAKNKFNMNIINKNINNDQNINYQFIQNCVSPSKINAKFTKIKQQSVNLSQYNHTHIRKSSQLQNINKSSFPDIESVTPFIQPFQLLPFIEDFSNYQIQAQVKKTQILEQQLKNMKKENKILQLVINDKNNQIQQIKKDYDLKNQKLYEKIKEIQSINKQNQNNLQEKQHQLKKNHLKLQQKQTKIKQLQLKFQQTNQKLQKSIKQIKMYKSKFKLNYNINSNKQQKNRKYHTNCCQDYYLNNFIQLNNAKRSPLKTSKNNQNKLQNNKNIFNKNKNNKDREIKQNNSILLIQQSEQGQQQQKKLSQRQKQQSINLSNCETLKKVKSQQILPIFSQDLSTFPLQFQTLHIIHSLQQEQQQQYHFNNFSFLTSKIQFLTTQLKYKDIQILTLKKTKTQLQKQLNSIQKLKITNKKLLARVEYLTKENQKYIGYKINYGKNKINSKKSINNYDDQNSNDDEQKDYVKINKYRVNRFDKKQNYIINNQLDCSSQLFQLSPEKYPTICQQNRTS